MTTTTPQIRPATRSAFAPVLRSWGKLTAVKLKLFLREPIALFFNLCFPVLVLLLYGFIWGTNRVAISARISAIST